MKKPYSKYKVNISPEAKRSRTMYDEHTGKTITFDSNIEKKYYTDVIVPYFKSGKIIDYDLQKKYTLQEKFRRENGELVRAIDYVADFWVVLNDGSEKVRDTKGAGYLVDTVAKIKRKMMWKVYPDIDFEWITWSSATGWIIWDDYMNKKRKDKINAKKQNTKSSR